MSRSMEDIKKIIKVAAQKYYSGYPIITDDEFDSLVEELRRNDPDNELLKVPGWGFDPTKVEFGVKVNHRYGKVEGISNKPRSIEGVPNNLRASNTRVRISAKLDGLSCVLYYKDGIFVQALTRGNGTVGIDITKQMNYILRNDVRYRVIDGFTGAIRGELVIPFENWNKIEASKDPSKNPRNYASGIINRHGISEELKYIHFVAYKIIAWENCNEYLDTFSMTEKLVSRFEHVVDALILNNGEKITEDLLKELFNEFKKKYPCDGCVITNSVIKYVPNSPDLIYDEVAFKFESERAATTIDHIEWKLSRTGMMKPVAVVGTVNLAGTNVSRCTCFNAKYVIDNVLGKGAVVEIEKSGEIIPDIQKVLKHAESPDIPDICPRCGEKLELIGADLKCTNPECSGMGRADLMHWTNVIADVDGLGGKIKDNFFDSCSIDSIEMMYEYLPTYCFGDSATEEKLKEMTSKLLDQRVDAVRALVALNIPRLGWKSAEKIVDAGLFSTLAGIPYIVNDTEDFNNVLDEITKVVGQATRKSIELNTNKISRLKFLKGRVVKKISEEKKESKGSVVITGKLNSGTRKEFESVIVNAGYELGDKISKDTLYLITNTPNSGSSKNKKADELGVKKITESEFLNLIKE